MLFTYFDVCLTITRMCDGAFFLDGLNHKIYRQISLNLLNKNLQGKRLTPFFVLLVTPLFVDILTNSNIVYNLISKDIINE